jgi:hypothetical protein
MGSASTSWRRRAGTAGVAAGYFRRAGFRSGRYDGDGLLLMVGSSNGSEREVAEVAKASLERLGFEVRLPVVTQDVMLARFCAVPAADADMLVLRVVDDGVGGADPTGGGLSGLRDRVHAVDGELLVASAPGTGTAIEAGLPLSRAHELPTAAATA